MVTIGPWAYSYSRVLGGGCFLCARHPMKGYILVEALKSVLALLHVLLARPVIHSDAIIPDKM